MTIALETGVQNFVIPILVLQNALPHPESDIGMIGPLAVAIATQFPLLILTIIRYEVRQRCCRGSSDQMKRDDDRRCEDDRHW